MTSLVRKVRAAAGLTVTWGVGWAIAGSLIGMNYLRRAPNAPGLPRGGIPLATNVEAILSIALNMGLYGAFTGACFATLVTWRARRRGGATFTAARLTSLGALAGCSWIAVGLGYSLITERPTGLPAAAVTSLLLNAALGAGAGWITWRIARRAQGPDNPELGGTRPPELLASGRELRASTSRQQDHARTRSSANIAGAGRVLHGA